MKKKSRVMLLRMTFFILCFTQLIFAQEDALPQARNQLFLEGGGMGGYGAISYQRLFLQKSNWKFSGSLGISTNRLKNFKNEFQPDLIFPILLLIGYGKKNHYPEFGLTQSFTSITRFDLSSGDSKRNNTWNGGLTIGYRFQTKTKNWVIKVNYYLIAVEYKRLVHWPGLSVGYAF